MANDLIPYKRPGEDVTGLATAAVTGKRFVQISGDMPSPPSEGLSSTSDGNLPRVAHPNGGGAVLGAAKRIFGVAKYDAASGKRVGVAREGIVPVTAGGNITEGAEVEAAADGRAVTLAAGAAVGQCLAGVTTGNDALIALY